MKKIFIAVLLLATGAFACIDASAASKKNKKTKAADVQVQLNTRADSLSYASGLYSTARLLDYLKAQFGITENDLAAFIRGFKDAQAHQDDKDFSAHHAGVSVYGTVQSRILPQTKDAFDGSSDSLQTAAFYQGFIAGVLSDTTTFTPSRAERYFTDFYQSNVEKKTAAYKQENEDWLKANAAKEGVVTTPTGLQYKVMTQGTGETPTADDEVTVKYVGRTIDGKEFDNSYKRNPQETTFAANGVIKGWTEALTMMPVGSKWELYIPASLAYGASSPAPAIKPNSTLIFEVELMSVKKKEEKPLVSEAQTTTEKPVKKAVAKKKRK